MTVAAMPSPVFMQPVLSDTCDNSLVFTTPIHNSQQQPLHRTNTFPRSRHKLAQRQMSATVSYDNDRLTPSVTPAADSQNLTGSLKGFRRGFSEQMQRLGRGTLDKLQRANRVRKLAGLYLDGTLA